MQKITYQAVAAAKGHSTPFDQLTALYSKARRNQRFSGLCYVRNAYQ